MQEEVKTSVNVPRRTVRRAKEKGDSTSVSTCDLQEEVKLAWTYLVGLYAGLKKNEEEVLQLVHVICEGQSINLYYTL